MTIKKYLGQIEEYRLKMEQLNDQYRMMRQNAIRMGSAPDGERVQSSVGGDLLSADVSKMVDAEQELKRRWNEYAKRRNKIIMQIQQMRNKNYEQVLWKRYVECKDFFTIADEMGYTYKYILNLHGWACKAFRLKVVVEL